MMRSVLMAGALCVASLAHAQSPADYTGAKQRADADEASLSASSADAMRDAQGIALDAAIAPRMHHPAGGIQLRHHHERRGVGVRSGAAGDGVVQHASLGVAHRP